MWHMSRVHLRGVGHNEARFDPLELDLTAGGDPCDTVWWLENGGGKTSLLSLVFAVLRPDSREFLGNLHKRNLGHYVQTGDVGHVVIEWRLPSDGLPGIDADAVLITGMTLEWADLRAQPDNRSALNRSYWGFRVVGDYGLEQLPFDDDSSRPRRARAFADQLARDLDKVTAAQLHRADDNQSRWHTWLDGQRLDPEVFRFQIAMNADEGAIAEAFTFPSGDAFVEWALKVAADPALPGSVASALQGVQARIHQLPQLELERELCDGAGDRLGDLAAAHELIVETTAELRIAQQKAADLARSIELAADAAETAALSSREAETEADEAARKASTEARQAQRHANRWTQLATQAAAAQAEQDDRDAIDAVADAKLQLDAWTLTTPLADHARLTSQRQSLEEQLERFEEGLTPLKEQLAAAEQQLTARAAHVTADIAAAVDRAAAEQKELDHAEANDGDTAQRLRDTERAADRQVAEAEAALRRCDQLHAAAVEDGVLAGDADVPTAVESAAETLADAVQQVVDVYETRQQAEQQAEATSLAVDGAKDALRTAKAVHDRATRLRKTMTEQAAALEVDELLVTATQSDPAEVWAQPTVTLDRLHRLADEARRDQVDAQLQTAETDRIVEALAADGYAPPSPDITTALRLLDDAGIPAVAGYRYLAGAIADDRRAAALHAAPDVASGIVITDPAQLDSAADTLDGLVPTLPVTLGSATLLTDDVGSTDQGLRRVIAPDPAVYDHDAAIALDARLHDERGQLDTAIETARQRVAQLGQTIARYEALHRDWPDPRTVVADADTAETGLQDAQRNLDDAARLHDEALTRRGEARASIATAEQARDRAQTRHDRLHALAEAWDGRADAVTARQEAADTLEQTREQQEGLDTRRSQRDTQRRELTGHQQQLASEGREVANTLRRAGLAPLDADAVPDPGGTLEALEEAVAARHADLLRARTEQQLSSQLDAVARQLADLAATIAAADISVAEKARRLLRSPSGQDLLSRQAEITATATEHHLRVELRGRTDAELQAARREQSDAERLDAGELPAGTVIPAAASDRRRQAEAASRRSHQRNEERGSHTARASRHRTQAERAESRAKLLRQTLGHLSGDAGSAAEASDDVGAYPGETTDADDDARNIRGRISELTGQQQAAVGERQEAHHRLLRFVRSERYTSLLGDGQPTSRIADRLTDEDAARIAGDAAALEQQLQSRGNTIDKDLAEVAEHRQLLIDHLVAIARDAVKLLSAIQARSRMPDGLAGWSSRRFIEIRHDPLPDEMSVLADRIGRVVDQLVEQQTSPDGSQLLYRVARAAVGDQPFTVKIIKPHMDLRYDRADISDLVGFSGGQKVTTAIALFTTMLNMRADTHAQGRSGNRATLLLDNPFGKSSADAFVKLQRQVAERLGVQLVFTTAVKDLAALSQFRRVIRLEHGRNRRNGALHVVEKQPATSLVSAAVTRAEAPEDDSEPAA